MNNLGYFLNKMDESLNRYKSKNGDDLLNPSTISFDSMKEYQSYLEETWLNAAKDKNFMNQIHSLLIDETRKAVEDDYDYHYHNFEKGSWVSAGAFYKGEALEVYVNLLTDKKVDSIDFIVRPTSLQTVDAYYKFTDPIHINGKPFDPVDEFVKTSKLKSIEKIISNYVIDEIQDLLRDDDGDNGNMSDYEFHRYANPNMF